MEFCADKVESRLNAVGGDMRWDIFVDPLRGESSEGFA